MSDAEKKGINEPGETDFAPESVEATDESEATGEEAAGEEAAGEEAVAEKKPLTTEEQLEEAKARADENYQNYLRSVAALDTYKRRVIREKDDLRQYALSGLLESVLPVYDNMALGLMSAEQDSDPKVVVQGIQMVLAQFKSVLEENGIEEIVPAKGAAFDHNHHEAVQSQPSSEVEEGAILQLIRKGFMLNGRLVRPATVIVAGEEGE
jgi:molecular chaperone GrpE